MDVPPQFYAQWHPAVNLKQHSLAATFQCESPSFQRARSPHRFGADAPLAHPGAEASHQTGTATSNMAFAVCSNFPLD